MFDFEKLEVYQIAKTLVIDTLKHIYAHPDMDPYMKEQWKRASMAAPAITDHDRPNQYDERPIL